MPPEDSTSENLFHELISIVRCARRVASRPRRYCGIRAIKFSQQRQERKCQGRLQKMLLLRQTEVPIGDAESNVFANYPPERSYQT